jgi:exodeoxyribonuclease-3
MRLYSWNVNGLRAAYSKPVFKPWLADGQADVVCLQETKARPEQLSEEMLNPPGYHGFFSSPTLRKGYSGVAVYSRARPLAVSMELPEERFASEGRLLSLEYERFHLLNVYFPNGQRDDERLDFKMGYYDAFLAHAQSLRRKKPVVVCGDFNTAHREIDLARPDLFEDVSGFLKMERDFLTLMIREGYIDTFRRLNGEEAGRYTWWSYRTGDRVRNEGWRIDYFFVSAELERNLARAWIEDQVPGSDHCPIGLELAF